MDIFVSPTAAVLARFVCFVAGSVLAVLIVLTVWDEDVLNVEHILTIMTVLGGKSTSLATYISDVCSFFGQVRAVCLDGFSDHCIFVSPYFYY